MDKFIQTIFNHAYRSQRLGLIDFEECWIQESSSKFERNKQEQMRLQKQEILIQWILHN